METLVSQIGCRAQVISVQSEAPTDNPSLLADLARKKSTQRLSEIVDGTKLHLHDVILQNADKNSYFFNMKKYVGDKFSTECSLEHVRIIREWLYSEGFVINGRPATPNTGRHSSGYFTASSAQLDEFGLTISW